MMERRQSIRVDCELSSEFRSFDVKSPLNKVSEATVINISRGGVRIRTDEFVPVQANLYIYLHLPQHETIEIRIIPTWVNEVPNLNKYEVGARFVEITSEQEDAIQDFQYRTLLQRLPSRRDMVKDLQADEPPGSLDLAA